MSVLGGLSGLEDLPFLIKNWNSSGRISEVSSLLSPTLEDLRANWPSGGRSTGQGLFAINPPMQISRVHLHFSAMNSFQQFSMLVL